MHRTLPVVVVEGYGFSGPLSYQEAVVEFAKSAGIYIVARGGDSIVVDVGSARDVGERLSTHDRKACWNFNSSKMGLTFYAHIEPGEFMRFIREDFLRQKLEPLCGVR